MKKNILCNIPVYLFRFSDLGGSAHIKRPTNGCPRNRSSYSRKSLPLPFLPSLPNQSTKHGLPTKPNPLPYSPWLLLPVSKTSTMVSPSKPDLLPSPSSLNLRLRPRSPTSHLNRDRHHPNIHRPLLPRSRVSILPPRGISIT